jgi:ankyrin repeat protein
VNDILENEEVKSINLETIQILFFFTKRNLVKNTDIPLRKMLDRHDVPFDTRDKFGRTIIHYIAALANPDSKIDDFSLDKNIKIINFRDKSGHTALDYAIRKNNTQIAKWLVDNGARNRNISCNSDEYYTTPFENHVTGIGVMRSLYKVKMTNMDEKKI